MGKQRFSKNKIKFLLLLTFITISTSALFIFYREPIKVEACDTQNNLQEFLYDINEQPSFILTSFQDGGYGISSAVTGEPIEFSKINNLPYDNGSRKYYGGPFAYIEKRNGQFYNVRAAENNEGNSQAETGKTKKFDRDNLIKSNADGISGAEYMDNRDYFSYNLQYGANSHNTCGSVATQILLSYTNYYFDRRIVSPSYLNGAWRSPNNGDRFDRNNYNIPSQDPNACSDPTLKDEYILMTNNDFYNHIISINEPEALQCVDTITTTVVNNDGTTTVTIEVRNINGDEIAEKVVETHETKSGEKNHVETKHSHSGSYMSDVKKGVQTILNNSIGSGNYTLNDGGRVIGLSKNEYADIRNEIKSNRPVILLTNSFLGGPNHFTVAYGYADYTYPGKDEAFSGFITDFGWGSESHNVWLNSSWCAQYLSVQTKHEHNYNIDTGKNFSGYKREVRCGECGHRTLKDIYSVDDEGVLTVNYSLSGEVTIPYRVGDKVVSKIGEASFMDNRNITSVSISYGINEICNNAFNGCVSLNSVSLPSSLQKIGTGAFQNCAGLRTMILPTNVEVIEAEAFKDTPLSIVYYEGTRGNLNGKSFSDNFRGVKVYFYSAYKPTSGTNYWRYVSGYPQIWGSMRILNSQANGVSRSENTTQITLTFSENPGNLTKYNFKTTDCKVTGVSGSGVTRVIEIEKIKVRNKSLLNMVVTPANEKYFEDPTVRTTVYRMCANVNYCDFGRSFFSGQFDTLFPRDVIYGEDVFLPIPKKKGYEFDGWLKEKADGSFESISCVPLPYFSETPPDDLTVYAKWKRAEVDFGNYDQSCLAVSYNTRGEDFNPRDMFFANADTYLSDFSYALREVLIPALSRLSYNGYTYEYNIDLIDDMVISEDLLTATITLRDDIKFSNGALIMAEDFIAYYEMIKSMYSVLPEPWSLISSIEEIASNVFTIELTDRCDFAYVLHEFRAISKDWFDDFAKTGKDPFEHIPEIPVYGKYQVERFESDYRIRLTANECYLWAADTLITDIDIYWFSDVPSNMMGFQAGEFDISFNFIEMDDEGFFEWGSECYQYDDRSRIFLGIGKESPLCRVYDEGQLQGLIKVLGKTINYKKLNEVFINTICEKSGWYTDKMIKVEYDGSPWWADMEGNPLGREDVIMLLEGYGIYIDDLNFEIYVPDNDICRKIAEEIVADFEAVGIPASLNITQNKSEMKTSDLCLFLYDFTGGNVISDCILNMEDVDNQVFLFISEEDMATLESLKYQYKCADTNEEKKQIMLEVHDIMIQYVVKLNAILKMYLVSNELYEATGGNIWKLIY